MSELGVGQVGRRDGLRRPEDVLVVVVVELAAGEDLPSPRHADVLVAHQRKLELATADELLNDDVVIELEGTEHRVPERCRVGHLRHADGRPEVRRFHEEWETQRVERFLHGLGGPRRALRDAPCRYRQPVVMQDGFRDALVHANGRRKHPGAHVGNLQRLQVSLNHAVLPEWAVQHREDNRVGRQRLVEMRDLRTGVFAQQDVGRGEALDIVEVRQHAVRVDPSSVVCQTEGPDDPPAFERRPGDAARRNARDLVLRRRPAVDDRQLSWIGHRPRLYKRRLYTRLTRAMRAILDD